jgi:BMFP domain-containing protein YqiC
MEEKGDTRVVSKSSGMKVEQVKQIDLIKREISELNKQHYESLIRIRELTEENDQLRKKINQLEDTLYDIENYRGK